MNKLQKTYMNAKAAYDTALTQKIEALNPYEHLLDGDDNQFEEYTDIEMSLDDKFQCSNLYKAMRSAEDAMIAWAHKKTEKHASFTSEHRAARELIMANIHMPSVRSKMVDLAFRLK